MNWKFTYFGLSKFSLSFLGFWPKRNLSVLEYIQRTVNFGILSYIIIGELTYAAEIAGTDLILAFDALCPCVTRMVTSLKIFLLVLYREDLKSLMDEKENLIEMEKQETKLKLIQKAKTTAFLYVFLVFFSGNSTNMFYFFRPIAMNIYSYSLGQNTTRYLPFKVLSPYDVYKSPMYEITYLLLGYSGVITVFGFSGIDGSYIGLCQYISVLFKSVQFDLLDTIGEIKGEQATLADNDNLLMKLKYIIKKHNNAIELSNKFSELYRIIILAHFLSAAVVLGISSINFILTNVLTFKWVYLYCSRRPKRKQLLYFFIDIIYLYFCAYQATGFARLIYVFYNAAVLFQLYIYCSGGTSIAENSFGVAEAVYCCEWYKCDVRIQKMVLMILLRGQRGTKLKVPFFTPSLETYGLIIKTSGSFITLFQTLL